MEACWSIIMRLKTNQQYKNINNRLKIQKGRIIDLLYKISLLKRLTKSSSSGNRMDNLGATHYYCLEYYWSIIMRKRNQINNQKMKIKIKKHKKTHNKVVVLNYKTPKAVFQINVHSESR